MKGDWRVGKNKWMIFYFDPITGGLKFALAVVFTDDSNGSVEAVPHFGSLLSFLHMGPADRSLIRAGQPHMPYLKEILE